MKRLLLVFSVVAVAATGLFAFTEKSKPAPAAFADNWYRFIGNPTVSADLLDETQYILTTSVGDCDKTAYVCAIKVPGPDTPGANPSAFTPAIETRIQDAASHTGPLPNTVVMKNSF